MVATPESINRCGFHIGFLGARGCAEVLGVKRKAGLAYPAEPPGLPSATDTVASSRGSTWCPALRRCRETFE